MRQIKFRAWIIEEKRYFNVRQIIFSPESSDADLFIEDNGYEWFSDEIMLEQSTGLCDKNGKEIYEGDIFQWLLGHIEPIYWDEDLTGWNIDKAGLSTGTVIGNIHENGELLK